MPRTSSIGRAARSTSRPNSTTAASGIAPRFLAKESLFRVPVLGALLRSARQIPVLRGTSRSGDALDAAREARDLTRRYHVFQAPTLVIRHGDQIETIAGASGIREYARAAGTMAQ